MIRSFLAILGRRSYLGVKEYRTSACGTGLGLEYERPRRRRILRSVRGLARLPVSLRIISFTMSRCHDAGSNPYFEGSQRVHSIIFLRIRWPRILFLPVDFRSNLPPRPRRAIRTSQSRTVEYGLISSRAMDRIPLPSLRLQQATRMSLALPGDGHSIMRQIFSLLVSGRNPPPLGSLAPLRTGARENTIRVRNICPDQNLSVNERGHLNSDGKLAKHFDLPYA